MPTCLDKLASGWIASMDKPKNNPKDLEAFTSNEVAVLVEGLRSDFRAVTEGLTLLTERADKVEERLATLETKVDSLSDIVRVAIPNHEKRISKIEAKIGV